MNPLLPGLRKCPDCGVDPGYTHFPFCDVERCSVCGGQRLSCKCEGHDPIFARWSGIIPGLAEARALDLYAKWPGKNGQWEKCDASDPEGVVDMNTFYSAGYYKIFFIKPSKENEREI